MDRTFSELVTQHLQPVILVTTSPSVEASSLKCGLTFTEHLRPFFQRSEATQPVTIRNLSGRERSYKSLAYRLTHSSEFQAIKVQQMNQYIKFRLGNMMSMQNKIENHSASKSKYNPNHPNGDESLSNPNNNYSTNNNNSSQTQPHQANNNNNPLVSSAVQIPSFLLRTQHRAEHLFLSPLSNIPTQTSYLFGFNNTTLQDHSHRNHHSHHSLQNVHNSLYTTSVHSSTPIIYNTETSLSLTNFIDNFTTANSDPTTLPQTHITFSAFQSTRRSIRTFFTRMPDPTPWYNRLRQIITEFSHFSSTHLLDQPIAQILAISASEPQPLHTLQQLSYHHNTPTAVREVLSTNGEKTSTMNPDVLTSYCQQAHENFQRPIQYGAHPLHRIYAVVVDHDITHGLNILELVLIYLRFYRNPSQMRKLKELWNTAVFTHDFIATELLVDVAWIRDYLFIRESGIWGSSATNNPKPQPTQPGQPSQPPPPPQSSGQSQQQQQLDPIRQLEGEIGIEDESYYFNRQYKRAQRHQQRQQQQQQQQGSATSSQSLPPLPPQPTQQQQQQPTSQYNPNDVLKTLPSVLKVENSFPLFYYLLNQWSQAQQQQNQQSSQHQQHQLSIDQPLPGSIQHSLAVATISDTIKWSTHSIVDGVEVISNRVVKNPFLATIDEIFTTQAIIINNVLIPTILPNYIWIGCCSWLTSLEFQRCVLAVDLYNDISTSLKNTALTLSAIDATLHANSTDKNPNAHTGKDNTSVSTTISSTNHELVIQTSARRFELNVASSMIHIYPFFNNTTYLNCLTNVIGSIETLGIVADTIAVNPVSNSNSTIQSHYLSPTLHNSQFTSIDAVKATQKYLTNAFLSHLSAEQTLKSPPTTISPSYHPTTQQRLPPSLPVKPQNNTLLLTQPYHSRNIGATRGRFDFNRRRHEILKRTLKLLILTHQTTYLHSTNHPAAQLLQQARVTSSSFKNSMKAGGHTTSNQNSNNSTNNNMGNDPNGFPRAISTSHLSSQRHKDLMNGYQANYQQTNVVMNLNRNGGLYETLGALYEQSIHNLKTIGFLSPDHEMAPSSVPMSSSSSLSSCQQPTVATGVLGDVNDLSSLLTPFDPHLLLAQRWVDGPAIETNTNQTSYLFPPTLGLLSIQQQKRVASFITQVQDSYVSSHPFFNLDQFLSTKITIPNHHLNNNIFHPAQNSNSPTVQQQIQEKSFFKIPIRPFHLNPLDPIMHPEPHPATQVTSFYAIPLDDSLRSSITGILQQWTSDSPLSPTSTASITTTTSGSSLRSTLITPQQNQPHASGPVIARLTSLSVINPLTFAKELGLKTLTPSEIHSLDNRARKHLGHRSAFTRIGKLPRLPAPQTKSMTDWFSPAFPLNPSMTHFPFLQPAFTRHLARGMHTNLLVEKPLLTIPMPTSLLTHFGIGPYHSVIVELDSVGKDMKNYGTTIANNNNNNNNDINSTTTNNTLDNLGNDDLYDEYDDEEDEDDDSWAMHQQGGNNGQRGMNKPMTQLDPSPSFFSSSPPVLMKGPDGYHPPFYFQHNALSLCALQNQASKIMQSLAGHLEHLIHSTNTKTNVKKSFKSSIRGLFSFSGSSGSSNAHELQQNQLFYNNSLKRLYNVIIDLCGCPQCGNQSLNQLQAVQTLDEASSPSHSNPAIVPPPKPFTPPTPNSFGLGDALSTIKYVVSPQLRLAILMILTQEFSSAIQYLKAILANDNIKSPHLVAYLNHLLAICYSLYDTQPDGSLSVNNAITQFNLALTPMLTQLPYRLAYPKQDSLFFTVARLWTQSSSSSLQPLLQTLGRISHSHFHPPDHSTSLSQPNSFGPNNSNFNLGSIALSSSTPSVVVGTTTYILDPASGNSNNASTTQFMTRTPSQMYPSGLGGNAMSCSTQALLDTPNRAAVQDSSMLPLSMPSMQLLLSPNTSTNQLLHLLGTYVPAPQSEIYGEQKPPQYTIPNTGIAASSLASLFNNISIGGGQGQQYDLQSIATLFYVSDIANLINQPIGELSYVLEGWAMENFFYLTDLHRMPSTYKTPSQSPAEAKLLFSAKATGSATSDQYQSLISRKELTLPLLQKFSQCTCHVHDLQLFGHFIKNQVYLLEKAHESPTPSRKNPTPVPIVVSSPTPGVHSGNVVSFLDTFNFTQHDHDQKSFSTFTGTNAIFAASEFLKISQTTQLSAAAVSHQMAKNSENMALNGIYYSPTSPSKKDEKNSEPTNPNTSAPLQNPTLCLSPFILEQMAYAHLYDPKSGSPIDDVDDNDGMMMGMNVGNTRLSTSTTQKSYITRRSRYIPLDLNDSEYQSHIERFGQMMLIAAKSYLVHGYYLLSIRCLLSFTKLTPLMQKSSTCMIILDLLTTALDWYSSQLLYSHQHPSTILEPNHTASPQSRPFTLTSPLLLSTQRTTSQSSQALQSPYNVTAGGGGGGDKLKVNWWLHDTRERSEELSFIAQLRQYAAQLGAISVTHHFTSGTLHTAQQFGSLLFHNHFYKNNNARTITPPRPRSSSLTSYTTAHLPPMTFRVPNSFIPLVPSHCIDTSLITPPSLSTTTTNTTNNPQPQSSFTQRASCLHNAADMNKASGISNQGDNVQLQHLFNEFYKQRHFMQYTDHINSSLVIVDACDHCYQLATNSPFGQSGYLLHGGNHYGINNTNSFLTNATREILDTPLKVNLQSTVPPHLLPNYHKKLGLTATNSGPGASQAISLKNLNRQGTQGNINVDPASVAHYNQLILQQQQLHTLLTFEAFQSLYRICMLWNINSYLAETSTNAHYGADGNVGGKGLSSITSSLSSTSFNGPQNQTSSHALRYGLHSSQSELDDSTMTSFMYRDGQSTIYGLNQSTLYGSNSLMGLMGHIAHANGTMSYQSTLYDASTSNRGNSQNGSKPSLQSIFNNNGELTPSLGNIATTSSTTTITTIPAPTLATIPSPAFGSTPLSNVDLMGGKDVLAPRCGVENGKNNTIDPSIPTIQLPKLLPQEEIEYMQIPFPMYTILGTRLGLPHTQTTFVNHEVGSSYKQPSSSSSPSSTQYQQPKACALCCSGSCLTSSKTHSPAIHRRAYNPTSFSNTIQYVPLHLHGQAIPLSPNLTQNDALVNDQVNHIVTNNSHLSFVSSVFKASLQSRGNVSGLTDKSTKVYNILTEAMLPNNEKFFHDANTANLSDDLSTFIEEHSTSYFTETQVSNITNNDNTDMRKTNANSNSLLNDTKSSSSTTLTPSMLTTIPSSPSSLLSRGKPELSGFQDFGLPDAVPPHRCTCPCSNPLLHDKLNDCLKSNLNIQSGTTGKNGDGVENLNGFKPFSHGDAQFSVPLYEPITIYIALYNPLPVTITCSDVNLGLSFDILHDKPNSVFQNSPDTSTTTIEPDDPYRITDLSHYRRQFEVTSSQGQVVIRPYDTHIVELTAKLTLSNLNNSKGVLPHSVVQNVTNNGDFLHTLPGGLASIFTKKPTPQPSKKTDLMGMFMYDDEDDTDENTDGSSSSIPTPFEPFSSLNQVTSPLPSGGQSDFSGLRSTAMGVTNNNKKNDITHLLLPYSFDTFYAPIISAKFSHFTATVNKIPTIFPITPAAFDWLQYITSKRNLVTYLKREQAKIQNQIDANALAQLPSRIGRNNIIAPGGNDVLATTSSPLSTSSSSIAPNSTSPITLAASLTSYSSSNITKSPESSLLSNLAKNLMGNGQFGTRVTSVLPNLSTYIPTQFSAFKLFQKLIQNIFPINASRYTLTSNNLTDPFHVNYIADITTLPTLFQNTMNGAGFFGYLALFLNNQLYQIHLQRFKNENNSIYGMNRYDTPPSMHSSLVQFDHTDTKYQVNFNNYKSARQAKSKQSQQQTNPNSFSKPPSRSSVTATSALSLDTRDLSNSNNYSISSLGNGNSLSSHNIAGNQQQQQQSQQHNLPNLSSNGVVGGLPGAFDGRSGYDRYLDTFLQDEHKSFSGYTTYVNNSQLLSMQFALQTLPELDDSCDIHTDATKQNKLEKTSATASLSLNNQRNYVYTLFHNYSSLYDESLATTTSNPNLIDFHDSYICLPPPPSTFVSPLSQNYTAPVSALVSSLHQTHDIKPITYQYGTNSSSSLQHDYDRTIVNGFSDVISKDMNALFSPTSPGLPITQFQSLHEVSTLLFGPQSRKIILPSFFHPFYKPLTANPLLFGHRTEYVDRNTTNPHHNNLFINNYTTPTQSSLTTGLKSTVNIKQTTDGIKSEASEGGIDYKPTPFANKGNKALGIYNHPDRRHLISSLTTPKVGPINTSRGSITSRTSIDLMGMGSIGDMDMGMGGENSTQTTSITVVHKPPQVNSHEDTISLTLFNDDDFKLPTKKNDNMPHIPAKSNNDTKQLLFDSTSSQKSSKRPALPVLEPQVIPAFAKTLNILDAMGSLECLQDAEHSSNALGNIKQHYKLPPYLDPISLQYVNNQSYVILVNTGYAPIYNITFDSTHSHMISLYITDKESSSGTIGAKSSNCEVSGDLEASDCASPGCTERNQSIQNDFTQSSEYLELDDIHNLKKMVLLPGQSIHLRLLFRTLQTGLFDVQCSFAYNTMTRSQFLITLQTFPDDILKRILQQDLETSSHAPPSIMNSKINTILSNINNNNNNNNTSSISPETKFSALFSSESLQKRYIAYFLQQITSPLPVVNQNNNTIKSTPTSLARTLRIGQVINVLPSILVHSVDFRRGAVVDETAPCVWCAKKQVSYETIADWMYRFGWVTQAQSVSSYTNFISNFLKSNSLTPSPASSPPIATTSSTSHVPENSSNLIGQGDSVPQSVAIVDNAFADDYPLDLDSVFAITPTPTAIKKSTKTIKSLFAKASASTSSSQGATGVNQGLGNKVYGQNTNTSLHYPTTQVPSFTLSQSDVPHPSQVALNNDISSNNNLTQQPSPISLEDYQSFTSHLNNLLRINNTNNNNSSNTTSSSTLGTTDLSQSSLCPQICSCSPFGALMTIFDIRQNPLHSFSTESLPQSAVMSQQPSMSQPQQPTSNHQANIYPNNTNSSGSPASSFQPNNLDSLLLNLYSPEINISTILLSSLMFSADQCHLSSIVARDAYGAIVKSTIPNFVTVDLTTGLKPKQPVTQKDETLSDSDQTTSLLSNGVVSPPHQQTSLFSIPKGGSISFVIQLRAKNPSNFIMQSSKPLLSPFQSHLSPGTINTNTKHNSPISTPLTAAMPDYTKFDAPWLQTILSRGLIPHHDLFKFCPSSALMNDLGLTTTALEWIEATSNANNTTPRQTPISPSPYNPSGVSSQPMTSPHSTHCLNCGGVLSITQRLERLKKSNCSTSLPLTTQGLSSPTSSSCTSPLSAAQSLMSTPSFNANGPLSSGINDNAPSTSTILADCTCWQFHPQNLSTINLPLSLPTIMQSSHLPSSITQQHPNDNSILPFISLSRNASTASNTTTPVSPFGAEAGNKNNNNASSPNPLTISPSLLNPNSTTTPFPTTLQNQQYRNIIAEDQSISLYHKQMEMVNPTRRFYNYHYYQHHPNHHIFTLRFTLAPPMYNPATSNGPNPVQQYQLGWKEQQDINKMDIITISSSHADSYNANDPSTHELPSSISFTSAYTNATASNGANYNTLFHGTSQPSSGYSAQALQEQVTALIQYQQHQQQVALIQRNNSMIGYVRTTTASPTTLTYPLTMLPALLEDYSLPTTYSSLLQLFQGSIRHHGNLNELHQLFKLSPITSSTHSDLKQFYALTIPMSVVGNTTSTANSINNGPIFTSIPIYLTDGPTSSSLSATATLNNSNQIDSAVSVASKLDYHNYDLIQSNLANGSTQSELLTRRISVTIFWNILRSFLPVFSHFFQSNPISNNFPPSLLYRITPPTLLINKNQLKTPSYHTYPTPLFYSTYFKHHSFSKQPLHNITVVSPLQHTNIMVEFASYFSIQEITLQPSTKNNSFSPLGSTAPSISPFNLFVVAPTPRGLTKLYTTAQSQGETRPKIPIMYLSTQRHVNWGPSTTLPMVYFTPFLKSPSLFHFHNTTSLHPPGATFCTCVNCMYYQQYKPDTVHPVTSTTTPITCHVKLLSNHITGSTQWSITNIHPNSLQILPLYPTQLEHYLEYFGFVAQSGGYNTKVCQLLLDQNERTEISRLTLTISLPIQMEFRSSSSIPFDPSALP